MRFKTADEAINAIKEVRWAPDHMFNTLRRIKNDLENENGNWYGHAEQASRLLDTLDEIHDYDYNKREDALYDRIRQLKSEASLLLAFHPDRKWHEPLGELVEWIKDITEHYAPPS